MEFRKRQLARRRQKICRAVSAECNKDYEEVMMLIQTDRNEARKHLPEGTALTEEMKIDELESYLHITEDTQEFERQTVKLQEATLQAELHDKLEGNVTTLPLKDDKTADDNEIEALKLWAIEENINFSALDKLLGILRKRLIPELPKSYKTLLNTELTNYQIIEMKDYATEDISGEFVYMGISVGLESCITNFHTGNIELIINIDGLPLTRSGRKCFWPILCKVHYIPDIYKPFIIAIYCGNSKPKDLSEYLKEFIAKLNYLQQYGIRLFQKTFIVKLKCFIADTPARSYLKCTKGHDGYPYEKESLPMFYNPCNTNITIIIQKYYNNYTKILQAFV